jgi:hypothetical protein
MNRRVGNEHTLSYNHKAPHDWRARPAHPPVHHPWLQQHRGHVLAVLPSRVQLVTLWGWYLCTVGLHHLDCLRGQEGRGAPSGAFSACIERIGAKMPSGPQQVHVGAFEILGGEVGGRSARQSPVYPKRALVDGCEHQPSHQTWRPLTPTFRSVTYAKGKTHVGARHQD